MPEITSSTKTHNIYTQDTTRIDKVGTKNVDDSNSSNLSDAKDSINPHYKHNQDLSQASIQATFDTNITTSANKISKIQTPEQAKQHILSGINAKYAFKTHILELAQHTTKPAILTPTTINSIIEHANKSGMYIACEEAFPSAKSHNHQSLRENVALSTKNLSTFEDKRTISTEHLKQILTNSPNLELLTCSPNADAFDDIRNYINANNNLEGLNICGGKFTTQQLDEIKNIALSKGFTVDNQNANILQLSKPIQGIKRTNAELVNQAMHEFNQYKFSLEKDQEEVFNILTLNPNAEYGSKLPNAQTENYGFQPENGVNIEAISYNIVINLTNLLSNLPKNDIFAQKLNTKSYINTLSNLGFKEDIINKSFNEAVKQSMSNSILRQLPQANKDIIKQRTIDGLLKLPNLLGEENDENKSRYKKFNNICLSIYCEHNNIADVKSIPQDEQKECIEKGYDLLVQSQNKTNQFNCLNEFLDNQIVDSTCLGQYFSINNIALTPNVIADYEQKPEKQKAHILKQGYDSLVSVMFLKSSLPVYDDFLINVFINGAKIAGNITSQEIDLDNFKSKLDKSHEELSTDTEQRKKIIDDEIINPCTKDKPQIAVDVAKHQLHLDGIL